MPCTGAAGETCGGVNAIEVFPFTCTGTVTPNYKGCVTALSKSQKYCDTSLTVDERIESMFANLTLDEKIGMISPQRRHGYQSRFLSRPMLASPHMWPYT